VTTGAQKKTPQAWLDPRSQAPGGTPSAGLSLGRLRPRRACLRFTRRWQSNQEVLPNTSAGKLETDWSSVPLNSGGPVLGADVGPFWAPITRNSQTRLKECTQSFCQAITMMQCDCNAGDECQWTGNMTLISFCGKNSTGNCIFDPMVEMKCEKGICKVNGNFCSCSWPKCGK